MPEYDIVEFYYDMLYERYGDDAFKSKEHLKDLILNRHDSKGTAKSWIDHPTDWFTQDYKGKALKGRADDSNDNYIKDIQKKIEEANTEEALDAIDVDEEYKEETVTELNEAIDIKMGEMAITVEIEGEEFEIPAKFERGRPRAMVSEEVRAASGEIIEEIVDAGEANDLDRLRAIEIRNVPMAIKKFLRRERDETIAAVEEELRGT